MNPNSEVIFAVCRLPFDVRPRNVKHNLATDTPRRSEILYKITKEFAIIWRSVQETVHTTLGKFEKKKQPSPVILDLCLRETGAGKSRDYRDVIVFEKVPCSKCLPSTLKRKAAFFKFLRFEERFRKVPFSWQISVDGRLNRRNLVLLFHIPPTQCRRSLSLAVSKSVYVVIIFAISAIPW